MLPEIPSPLAESSAAALEWPRLREHIAGYAARRWDAPGCWRWSLARTQPGSTPSSSAPRRFATSSPAAAAFDFHGLFDPADLLDRRAIEGTALEGTQINALLAVIERWPPGARC